MSTPAWIECYRAGMTAQEAADARGLTSGAARAWAYRHGVKFAPSQYRPKQAQKALWSDPRYRKRVLGAIADARAAKSARIQAAIIARKENESRAARVIAATAHTEIRKSK